MKRPPLPSVIADLVADRRAANTLLAGAAALVASGLDPKVWGPASSSVQAAIRARPDLEGFVLLTAVASAILLLVGGAIGDLTRARPVVLIGLAVSLVAGVVCLLFPEGGLFQLGRIVGTAAAAFVFPVALASVATAYAGVARATAIGVAYAVYGLAGAASPSLLVLIPDNRWPAFVAVIVACAVALRIGWNRVPDLDRPGRAERPYVLGTALWASGVVLLSTGIMWLGGGLDNPLRLGLIGAGLALVAVFFAWEWRRRASHPASLQVDRRPVTVALFVGLVIAIAQTVAMVQMPLYFSLVLKFGPLFGIVAVAPLFIALIAAGPIAGFMLARFSPRHLVAGGVLAVGIGNVAVAAVIGVHTSYLAFIIPLVLIGGGFVIATTVRTAIIFASVPRGLPATAAALNEASIAVGSRVGIVLVTVIVAQTAISALDPLLVGQSAASAAAARSTFQDLLTAVGTPSFASMAHAVAPAALGEYAEAYVAGIRFAMFLGGIAAILGSVVAWFALGRGDPLVARGTDPMAGVYEHRDERAPAAK